MTTLRSTVAASHGIARFVPFGELWGTAAVLAEALPLDRPATYPAPLRRGGHWLRLVLWDRALTDPARDAVLVVDRTPWAAAGVAAGVAAVLAPRSPRWHRRALVVLAGVLALRAGRIRDEVVLRRQLRVVAPGGLLVGDLVARTPGAAVRWIQELLAELDAGGHDATFVAILPGARRDAVRERIYTRRLGFRVAGQARSRGRTLTLLVRPPGRPGSVVPRVS